MPVCSKGATKINVDNNGRLLLPKGLLGWAGIKKEIVIVANVDLWEIWDRKTYENMMKMTGMNLINWLMKLWGSRQMQNEDYHTPVLLDASVSALITALWLLC